MKVDPVIRKDFPPKTILNIIIALMSYSSCILLLYFVNIQDYWYFKIIGAFLFSLVANTVFSLLHESVHNSFSWNKKINYVFGLISASFFPTSFTIQKKCHLGHHRRNRTDVEMFEMYYEGDNKVLKFLQLYSILGGVYWTSPPTGCLLYLFCPWLLKAKFLRSDHSDVQHMSADAMIGDIEKANPFVARLEIIFFIAFQTSLFYFLELTFLNWLLCYWAFALAWGGLQYADHAWTKRDIRSGAWNLRVNPVTKFFYLNYHDHKVHHIYPFLPWNYLPKFVNKNEERPSFWSIYFRLMKGPTLTTEGNPKYYRELDQLIHDEERRE